MCLKDEPLCLNCLLNSLICKISFQNSIDKLRRFFVEERGSIAVSYATWWKYYKTHFSVSHAEGKRFGKGIKRGVKKGSLNCLSVPLAGTFKYKAGSSMDKHSSLSSHSIDDTVICFAFCTVCTVLLGVHLGVPWHSSQAKSNIYLILLSCYDIF